MKIARCSLRSSILIYINVRSFSMKKIGWLIIRQFYLPLYTIYSFQENIGTTYTLIPKVKVVKCRCYTMSNVHVENIMRFFTSPWQSLTGMYSVMTIGLPTLVASMNWRRLGWCISQVISVTMVSIFQIWMVYPNCLNHPKLDDLSKLLK